MKEKNALIITNNLFFFKPKLILHLFLSDTGLILVDSIFALTTLSFGIDRQFDWRPITNADTESAHIPLWIAAVPSEQ